MVNEMAKRTRLDRVLAVDFELTCWDGVPPEGQSAEIIDIGVVEICVETLAVIRSQRFLVKPLWSEVSDYCTDLTGITPTMLRKQGRPLPEIASTLAKKWGSGSKLWLAWGRDNLAIERDAKRHGIENPFSAAYLNAGLEYSIEWAAGENIGLHSAMTHLGIEPGESRHSALNDAEDLAAVWIRRTELKREFMVSGIQSSPSPL